MKNSYKIMELSCQSIIHQILETVKAWQDASMAYAQGAQGTVRVVLGDAVKPTSVWSTIEFPALKANTKVTQVIQVDPKTGVETVIFKR